MREKTATQRRNERIWVTICDVPPGCVASYGQVAGIAGIPRGARMVGYALRQLPPGHDVPWHRIITSSGRIAFEKGSKPYREQVKRLKMEGVPAPGGQVDMHRHRWQPDLDELLWKPSATWDES
jgi:methylated-DNA-protein-cysteine methyltransferase-like protein